MLERDEAQEGIATAWPLPDASLVAYVEEDRGNILKVYKIKPDLIREHSGTEQSVLSSGYRYRQIFEVVQNAADAILEATDAGEEDGQILVRVTDSYLYVGNTGAPLNKDGIIALLGANSSRKRKSQIGRFGQGFKSLLALGGTIDLFSRSVSIRQFLEGRVKVLANYQVLATGFDAPKTATIVISRPVFSPVRYMQMVGRGLRGPENGGTEMCRIITVVDNLVQYGDRLAYHYFMRHYS